MNRLECIWGQYGAGKEVRTLDLYLGKVSLYQLSYSRKEKPITGMGFSGFGGWGSLERMPPTRIMTRL